MKQPMWIFLSLLSLLYIVQPARAEDIGNLQQLLGTRQCPKCNLIGAGLVLANLAGADLRGANLTGANLSRANLTGADLRGANLAGVTLFGANLTGANLSEANLAGVDLRQAYVVGADFKKANMAGTALQGTIGLPTELLKVVDIYNWGIEASKRGNDTQAITYFNEALSLDNKMAMAYLGRGLSRTKVGTASEALEDVKRAADLFKEQENTQAYETTQKLIQQMESAQSGGPDTSQQLFNMLSSVLLLFF